MFSALNACCILVMEPIEITETTIVGNIKVIMWDIVRV